MKIHIDELRCEGYGFCEQAAPDLLALDSEGELRVLVEQVPEGRDEDAAAAVRVCPMAALRLEP